MTTIPIHTSTEYNVHIGAGLLDKAGTEIAKIAPGKRVMIVSDDLVFPLYGDRLVRAVQSAGFDCSSFIFPNGEAQKRLSTLEQLLETLAQKHFCRSDLILALGGGVTGDMAGFAAAVFLRGVDYVQLPTTLLAAVDSSVGGKTAVDLSHGKNLCGAFHQPKLVLCDTDTFQTLKPLQWQDGLAEMLKYGVICDEALFERIQNYKNENLEALIARCVEIKRDVVSADEFDRGQRQLLNLGHTVGHAVEAASNFHITHGHAVAIGMAVVARGAERLGMAAAGTAARIERALCACSLPDRCDFDADTLAALTLSDKKSDGAFINLIIPECIGGSVIRKSPASDVRALIDAGL